MAVYDASYGDYKVLASVELLTRVYYYQPYCRWALPLGHGSDPPAYERVGIDYRLDWMCFHDVEETDKTIL